MDRCDRPVQISLPLIATQSTSLDSSFIRLRLSSLESLGRVPGFPVRLVRDSTVVVERISDAKGELEFRVSPGLYRLEARGAGYQITSAMINFEPGAGYSMTDLPLWTHPAC